MRKVGKWVGDRVMMRKKIKVRMSWVYWGVKKNKGVFKVKKNGVKGGVVFGGGGF